MARDDPQLKLRLPPELKARIEGAAANNGRSVNAEIVALLERAFENDDFLGELDKRVDRLEAAVAAHDEALGLSKYKHY